MSYQPIESHGVIGDMHTVALVAMNGDIDWCCMPRFDSPSIFGSLLDDRKGGVCCINTGEESNKRQMYLPDSNVLLTRFLSPAGVGEVIDFMPISPVSGCASDPGTRQIVRIARSVRGEARFQFRCQPAFNYARVGHQLEISGNTAVFSAGKERLRVVAPGELRQDGDGVVREFVLKPNERAAFFLRFDGDAANDSGGQPDAWQLLHDTLRFWRGWISRSRYRGRWRETVSRSALMLKLLTYQPTGAIIAAPTTSLPERIGGPRNWDYRYTWVRDAAFSVYALLRLGFSEEAEAFAGFVQARAKEEEPSNSAGPLNVLYGIDGTHQAKEFTLDHLDGYMGSKPVRVGNAAVDHLQLDIYGELLDSLYIFNKHGSPISYEMWVQIERMLEWVAANWQSPDQSIWEVRGGAQQFTYSKLQCWVALDRGLRLADARSFPTNRLLWTDQRDNIYKKIMQESWNDKRRAFVQYYGADTVDASVLMMPLVKFLAPKDPRMLSTIDAVYEELVSDSLVERYEVRKAARDGLSGGEGTFSVCSFWLVECIARAGRLDEARFLFEKMLTYANHVGLFAEEIGRTGEALGNFPQAFTHLGLISAAVNLDRLLDEPSKPTS